MRWKWRGREGVILGSFLELIDYDIEKERQASEFKIDLFVKRPLSLRFIFARKGMVKDVMDRIYCDVIVWNVTIARSLCLSLPPPPH